MRDVLTLKDHLARARGFVSAMSASRGLHEESVACGFDMAVDAVFDAIRDRLPLSATLPSDRKATLAQIKEAITR